MCEIEVRSLRLMVHPPLDRLHDRAGLVWADVVKIGDTVPLFGLTKQTDWQDVMNEGGTHDP